MGTQTATMDPNVKQVKVDNWGIYFLQRLKHFFNRTDYCDLTLQFQDNAQLKVHRLVLSACTEYFELLERTCEMYEDCLVMPDDLQADVVVPIVNFMYTGQLEFHIDSLERLYQTSQVMNMPVLTKLLEAHRSQIKPKQVMNYAPPKRTPKTAELFRTGPKPSTSSASAQPTKRNFAKAFANSPTPSEPTNGPYVSSTPSILAPAVSQKRVRVQEAREPRPTRYDLPEELDGNIFENSFSHISYTSEPIIVHPETRKKYPSRKPVSTMFAEASCSKKTALSDIMESKRIKNQNMFEDELPTDLLSEQTEMFQPVHVKKEKNVMSENIFDQMMDIPVMGEDNPQMSAPRVTIENSSPNNSGQGNIDHAKIISEVLKKYPHLMKSNKNIKLKILNTSQTAPPPKKKQMATKKQEWQVKTEQPDNIPFQSVLDSKEAARLIAMGIENVKGPWICLMCGTPGQALHFPSYYKFRRHLVEVHKEKAALNVCEYCGLKSTKRNYMLHHMYTKHAVEPPRAFHFPKCNHCSYVALSEALLIKHKMGHQETRSFRCNVCPATFNSSFQLLAHIRASGHKYSSEKRTNLQCIYCLKVFLRESNLYAHIKGNHKALAVQDGIIDDSDEEESSQELDQASVKFEPPSYDEYEESVNHNQLQQYEIRPDGNIQLVTKKTPNVANAPKKQKILNSGLSKEMSKPTHSGASYSNNKQVTKPVKQKPVKRVTNEEYLQEVSISPNHMAPQEEVVIIDNNEYVLRDNQLILRQKDVTSNEKYILSDEQPDSQELSTPQPMEFVHIRGDDESVDQNAKIAGNLNQNLIVVSNEEEYKALMNSNHSIIFDEHESNKTLTVLSTPHEATLSANVESDSQANDNMMIIQDGYPLNVSQAVPVDNNIVVVYSHQNKPYQIITSQGLGGQYVQSSAVMTQNFEAIDESTPVVTDHQVLIDARQAESWQSNIPTNEQIEGNLAIAEEPENASEDSMTELPEVTVPAPNEENTEVQSIAENTEHLDEDQSQTETEMCMSVDESAELTIAQPEAPQPEESYPADDMQITEQTHEVEESQEQHENVLEQNTQETDLQHSNEEQTHDEDTAENHTENDPETSEPADITANDVSYDENGEEQDQDESLEESTENIANNEASEVTKPVENLANEWSEDEYDTNQDNTVSSQEHENETEHQGEVEESIENIQQEMEKQMDPEIEDEESESQEDEPTAQEQDTTVHNAVKVQDPPPEKISSLLNDWEDNDSQDDSANGNEEEIPGIGDDEAEESEEIPKDEGNVSGMEPVKDDKLKSLVSDWDEDDEEKN